MQMPMLSYPNFSQFLQLHQHHEQTQNSRRIERNYEATSETSVDTSVHSNSPTPSISPPLPASDNTPTRKSFTIDAILGLHDARDREPITFHSAFHPRLRVASLPGIADVLHTRQDNTVAPNIREKSSHEFAKKGGGKSKRVRTIFTPEQLERLEAEFERQQYMVGPERLYLAHTLQLTEAQVKVWFQNRRIKWRKQHLEIQQQRLAVMKQRQRDDGDESGESDDSSSGAKFLPFNAETSSYHLDATPSPYVPAGIDPTREHPTSNMKSD